MAIAVFILLVVLALLFIFKGKLKEIMGEEILKWVTIGVAAAAAVCTLILITSRLRGYYDGSFIWMLVSLVMGVLLAGFLFNVLRLNGSLSSLSFNFGKLSLGEQLMAGGSALIVLITLYILIRALFMNGALLFSGRNISYIMMSLGALGFLIATLSGMTAAKSIPRNQLMIAAAALVVLELMALIVHGFTTIYSTNWEDWLTTGNVARNVFQFSRVILMLAVLAVAAGPFIPNNKNNGTAE